MLHSNEKSRLAFALSAGVAFFVPTSVHLPAVLGEGYSRSLITLLSISMVSAFLLISSIISFKAAKDASKAIGGIISGGGLITKCLMVFVLVSALAEMRGGLALAVPPFSYIGLFSVLAALFLAGYFLTATDRGESKSKAVIHCFVLSFSIYVLINVVGHFWGLQAEHVMSVSVGDSGANMMLGSLGISYPRVFFPFAAGLNNSAVFSGVCLLSALGGFRLVNGVGARILYLLAAGIGLLGVVLTDSRGVLLMVVLSFFISRIFYARKKSPLYFLLGLSVLGALAPYLIVLMSGYMQESGLAAIIQRDGGFANRLGAFSGRDIIWAEIIKVIFRDWGTVLFGYGSFGQISSGAAGNYAWIFPGAVGVKTAHNSALQILVDAGFLGVLVWLSLWAGAGILLAKLGETPDREMYRTFASILLMLILAGWTEATCTVYTMDMMMILVFVLGVVQGWSFSNSAPYDSNGKQAASV